MKLRIKMAAGVSLPLPWSTRDAANYSHVVLWERESFDGSNN